MRIFFLIIYLLFFCSCKLNYNFVRRHKEKFLTLAVDFLHQPLTEYETKGGKNKLLNKRLKKIKMQKIGINSNIIKYPPYTSYASLEPNDSIVIFFNSA